MAPNIEVEKLEDMSQEELMSLEDETAGADGDEPGETPPASEPKSPDQPADKGATPEDGGEEGDGAKSPDEPAADPDTDPPDGGDEDLTKHVSPPSKWAEERRAKRELKTKLEAAEGQAAKNEGLEQELTDVKSQLEWMKTAIQSKGVELPESPLDVFSEERLTEVRDEYGDELADMFQATAAILQKNAGSSAPVPAKATPEVKPEATPAATPAAEPAAAPQVDEAMMEAIDSNDDLAYWRENSAPLWEKAVATDNKLLADPATAKLSYEERFAKVVQMVKEEVTSNASEGVDTPSGKPPESLSGSGGETPQVNNNDALTKILATDNPVDQMKMYDKLSQDQKDEVDKALDI